MSIFQNILFGFVVLVSHFLEGITGFGCTVLALPFCISIAGVKVTVPVLVIIAWLLALYIMIIDFKKIVWREYIKIISFVILGLPFGMWMFSSLPEALLKKVLGIFMIAVSIRGIYAAFKFNTELIRPKSPTSVGGRFQRAAKSSMDSTKIQRELNLPLNEVSFKPQAAACACKAESPDSYKCSDVYGLPKTTKLIKYTMNFILFLGGVIHGAFGSGGPFVVIYATKALPNKSNFRATICTLWFTLNSIIIVKNLKQGVMTAPVWELLLWTLPFLAVGMVLGNYAHNRIKEDSFIKLVYFVMLVSGAFMLL